MNVAVEMKAWMANHAVERCAAFIGKSYSRLVVVYCEMLQLLNRSCLASDLMAHMEGRTSTSGLWMTPSFFLYAVYKLSHAIQFNDSGYGTPFML